MILLGAKSREMSRNGSTVVDTALDDNYKTVTVTNYPAKFNLMRKTCKCVTKFANKW